MINLFQKSFPINQSTQKAGGINLASFARPHMRGLWFSALSFHIAFSGWFAFAPLMPTIQKDIGLSKNDVYNANIASVSSTVIFRLLIGPFCDLYGPRRVMAAILLLGAIPVGLSGLVHDGTSLLIMRFFIGILGATFVPCQFWTTQMFDSKTVGSANALAGGWGNMGAGVTYLIMPLIYNLFITCGLTSHVAWRVAFLVPFVLISGVALCDLFFVDDCPQGRWANRYTPQLEADTSNEVREKKDEIVTDAESERQPVVPRRPKVKDFIKAIQDYNVVILMLQYACCFGFELAIDNVIGTFFTTQFHLDQTKASLIGSIFGLMNFFSRPSGGFLSDAVYQRFGIRGRMLVHFLFLLFEGIFLIIFHYSIDTLTSAIIVLIFFSFFTQGTCGTAFAIIPFVNPAVVGAVSGLVGSGGNFGGLILNIVFKVYQNQTDYAFLVIGILCICVACLSLFLKIEGQRIIEFKRK